MPKYFSESLQLLNFLKPLFVIDLIHDCHEHLNYYSSRSAGVTSITIHEFPKSYGN